MTKYLYYSLLLFALSITAKAQQAATTATATATATATPLTLSGTNLAQHDFFYAGEGNKIMSIVKKGKVVWTYTDTTQHGEISDATMLANGNILFARQKGISLISPDKKLLWNLNAPPNTEIHTVRPIGNNRIIYGQNGNPAKIIVVNIITGKTELEFPVAVKNLTYVHGQFRHISLTDAGTVLLANNDMGKVSEYDNTGAEIWSVQIPSPWYATRLKNGNTLITSYKNSVCEVDPQGKTVWKFAVTDLPDLKLNTFQCALRLPNGNTVLCNSCPKGDGSAVQAIEINVDKKLIWALRSWGPEVDLGRSTTIQILDKPAPVIEKAHFGKLN